MNWGIPIVAFDIFGGGAPGTDRKYELQSMGLLSGIAPNLTTAGQGTLASGTQGMQSVMNQLQKIMGGGQGELEAVAPQVGAISDQYNAARKAAAELSPRGGGRNATLSNSTFSQLGDVQKLMFGAAGQARGQAGDLASKMAELGLGETEAGVSASEGSADIGLQNAPFAAQQESAVGNGIGQILALMMAG